MKVLPVIVLFLWISQIISAQEYADQRLNDIDTFINRLMGDWNTPGVSLAIVENDQVLYAGGFGHRDVEKKLPVTENTLFAIGSCTKAFTSSILGMLELEEKVDLDKPVRDYLPDLKFKDEYANAHVTLRDMMCHRTGLPRHDYSWYGSTASRDELLERIQYLESTATLREKWQYNNFMFMAQGVVIEKLTGKSWERNLKERILDPLEMGRTNTSVIDMKKSDDRSLAYSNPFNEEPKEIPYRNIDAIGPAGSINSCASDMAHWLITWIKDGKYKGQEIIPFSYRNQAMTAQMTMGNSLPSPENPDIISAGYGLAWSVASYRGHYMVTHGGGIDGFSSQTTFFPFDSVGIFVVSANGVVTRSVRNFIADRMLDLSYRSWGSTELKQQIRMDSAKMDSEERDTISAGNSPPQHTASHYAGDYFDPGYGTIQVFLENDTLWVNYNEAGDRTKKYLHHTHYDIFEIRTTGDEEGGGDGLKMRFNTSYSGEIESLQIKMEPAMDHDIIFDRQMPKTTLEKGILARYVGDYDLNGATVKVYIKGEKTLMVLVPGQPDYELVAMEDHTFYLKVAQDYKVKFEVDGDENVESLSFIQPNGTFKAVRK